ncbi:esterase-like activity of phytase family protein [Streptomyces sp. NPDC052109]|uniref:caspase, EACC1-associated type n=1 Tax=Streptomyces sp. NPDC052109 TaxID=3155527 RepID=UPI003427F1FC
MTEAPDTGTRPVTRLPDPRLPNPRRSAAVLIGVSEYRHLPRLPAVRNNLVRLMEALTDEAMWGLPIDKCVLAGDPTTSKDLIGPVKRAARMAEDTLVVYYAGHGFVDRRGALHLTLTDSERGEADTTVPYDWLREALLKHSKARRRIIILDCCYSGRALEGMSDPAAQLSVAAAVSGSYTLASAPPNEEALSPRGEECTAFTGELFRVLRHGIREDGQEKEPYLTLDMIYEEVRRALRARGLPLPEVQDRNRIGRLPFVRNLAGDAPPWRPPRRRWPAVAAVATVLAAVATFSVYHWALADDAVSRRCSAQAELIGHSDRLDKSVHQGRRLYGLSDLALTDDSHALSLSDNAPPVLYGLSLGQPGGKPDPRVTSVTELRRKDGTGYAGRSFDGEAIALEQGGRTLLVASEAGPSISRFDMASGRFVTGFPVPRRFSIPQDGGEALEGQIFEAMALSPDGRYLYVGTEAPLSSDGSYQGQYLIRILRYRGSPGGRYVDDREFAYRTDAGFTLADLTPVSGNRFLALEHSYSKGVGNNAHIYDITFDDKLPDVRRTPSLAGLPGSSYVAKKPVVDLSRCPSDGATAKQRQSNPLLDNVEGMALGRPLPQGPYQGLRPLYLVTDDNDQATQTTRFYSLAVRGL